MKRKFDNMRNLAPILIAMFFGTTVYAQKPIIEWIDIPAGTFMMGSPKTEIEREKNETQHEVTLSAFKMSKYEITYEQYDRFCDATGRTKPIDQGWGRDNRPVMKVSWDDAQAFAGWMDCRLPTEAEWEYACRAGTTTPFYTGDNLTTEQANYNGNYPYYKNPIGSYYERTMKVGRFEPNAWGLYDMHGNVWEWCSDWLGEYPVDAQTNPQGPQTGTVRVLRGGSWYGYAAYCRSAFRDSRDPTVHYDDFGFRIVCSK
jgi:sulfatase modifying factor 1